MAWKQFNPGCACCGKPLILISTCDSSVNYTYLCSFELADGTPGNSCATGETNCVYSPKQFDIDKWYEDKEKWEKARDDYQEDWPAAAGIISGGFRCWAGQQEAIYPYAEEWAEDTYGYFEYMTGGTDANNRITLQNLQTMFTTLLNKHELEEEDEFGFLFVIDNTGSITVAQWGSNVKQDFLDWIDETYPQCEVKEVQLNNYLVDGEDWLRHFAEYYTDVGKQGLG